MKRIVNGVTYNTETSTPLAMSKWGDDEYTAITGTLYQTRGGAFFLHAAIEKWVWNPNVLERELRHEDKFEPMSPEDAHQWILEGDVEIFSNPFEDPPEATAEGDPGETIYIRVPASLEAPR